MSPGDGKVGAKRAADDAADHGHGFALWQLGRMYADGDGVKRDDLRAFEYFQKFADSPPPNARTRTRGYSHGNLRMDTYRSYRRNIGPVCSAPWTLG